MAFESLTDRLAGVFKKLRGHGKLTEEMCIRDRHRSAHRARHGNEQCRRAADPCRRLTIALLHVLYYT